MHLYQKIDQEVSHYHHILVSAIPLVVSSQNHMTPAPIGPPSAHLAVHQSQESYFHICRIHAQIRLTVKHKDNHKFTGQARSIATEIPCCLHQDVFFQTSFHLLNPFSVNSLISTECPTS